MKNGYQLVCEAVDPFISLLHTISNPQQLLKWMSVNLSYGYIGKDGKRYEGDVDDNVFYKQYTLQSPKELFYSKLGVCWDQVEFERVFFKKFNFKIHTVYTEVNTESHTFLVYEKTDGLYWFENSFAKKRGIHGPFKNIEEIISKVNNSSYWVEYEQPKYGLSCQKFMDFVKKEKKTNIELHEFDYKFYKKNVSKEDHDKTGVYGHNCIKHSIWMDDVIVGFVGYIPSKKDPKIGFIQILILPKYRGKGILQTAEDMIAKKHNLKSLWATIALDNEASIKAHIKAGFKYFPDEQIKKWQEAKLLETNQTRLYKNY